MAISTIAAFGLGLYLWIFIQTVLHEAAHVLVGRMAGFSPYALSVGRGPLLFHMRLAGVEVRIRALPFFGGVVRAWFPLRGISWRGSLFAIAGIASDTVLLALTVSLAGFKLGFFAMLALYQVMVLLGNLIPSHVILEGMRIPNDGAQFLAYLTGRTSVGLKAYEQNVARYDPTFRMADAWIMRGDPALMARFSSAEQQMAARSYAEATQTYLGLVAEPSIHAAEKALILDRIACIPLIDGDKRFLADAEVWSRRAYELFPDCKTLHGTLGSILVERGHFAAGLVLLMPLTQEDNSAIDRALAACFAAKALHALGRTTEASKWIRTARSSGQFTTLCSRIEAELSPAPMPG